VALNVYDSRRAVYVTPFSGSTVNYGFLTNVLTSIGTACGHTAYDPATPVAGIVFGANAPKPGRASKQRAAGGTDSTFYDISRASALRADGYSLSRPSIRRGTSNSTSKAVYVTLGTIKYAWRMPVTQYNRLGADLALLGIQDATSADNDLVWGSNTKPPKVSKRDGTDTLSTFVDPQRVDNLPAGWSSAGREYVN